MPRNKLRGLFIAGPYPGLLLNCQSKLVPEQAAQYADVWP